MARLLTLALSVAAFALHPAGPSAAAEPLKVVASFSIIADMAENVGGDRVEITTLVGPNGDTHVYEPRPADAAAVGTADVVLANGLHLEGFLKRLVEASGTTAPVVELAKGSTLIDGGEDAHGHGEVAHDHHDGDEAHAHEGGEHGTDPHAWQSVRNAEIYVRNIAEAFCAADAAGCAGYKERAEVYVGRLEALDAEIRATVAQIPDDKRTIITSHDAFGYFARDYGIRFLAPEGISTDSEASAADVAALIRQIAEDKASAVFVENISNPRLVERIVAETGLKVGGELFSDALSDESGPAPTYIDMMRHNLATIRGAILGS